MKNLEFSFDTPQYRSDTPLHQIRITRVEYRVYHAFLEM